ncbi:MAG: tetrahydromethanopterin-linked C1 transfer pathway [Pirellulaceae bacterium]|nr:tetrahydromethanopterin-linked C1 transfer pathway [Pirellulaceae bacterium]
MNWLAVDIGGANLKLADGDRFALVRSFPLWKQAADLAAELTRMFASAPNCRNLAVTMTGELADCFATKAEGVRCILQQVLQAVAGDGQIRVYLTDGRLVPVEIALAEPLAAAASNWHALAAFAGRFAPLGPALLIDIGSTTCDLIPLLDGRPAAVGSNDTQRMLAGELLYTGVERSPVCAVVDRVPYRGGDCPPAQEWFATMRDVYLIRNEIAEDPVCCDTADGRPATRQAAEARLARMICADVSQFDTADAMAMADAAAAAQTERLACAYRSVTASMPAPPRAIVASGHGDFLMRRMLEKSGFHGQILSLTERLGPAMSRVATAHALAVLASEQCASPHRIISP